MQDLIEMGFDGSMVRIAYESARGDKEVALDILLSGDCPVSDIDTVWIVIIIILFIVNVAVVIDVVAVVTVIVIFVVAAVVAATTVIIFIMIMSIYKI
jgi:hypothetical protein